ncbi:MAG: O-antigen ligase family protein [Acidobacteriota bacterium]
MSIITLALIVVVELALALAAPFHSLMIADFVMLKWIRSASLGGVSVDKTDVMLGMLVLAVLVRGRFRPTDLAKHFPHFVPWFMLGSLMTASYLHAPINHENLTDPIRISYQVYRYCWKPIIFYPLALLLLRDYGRIRWVMMAIVIGADIISIQAIIQGYTTGDAVGPFRTKNQFSGTLVPAVPIALAHMLFPRRRWEAIFGGFSWLLMMRAITISGSRGGLVGALAGCALFCAGAMLISLGRKRLLKLAPLVVAAPILLILVNPAILEAPTVKQALSTAEGTKDSNMAWRIEQRWPHFWEIAWQTPWLGRGYDVDYSLGPNANTPHNGYLSIFVIYGLPVLFLLIWWIVRHLRNCFALFFYSRDIEYRFYILMLAAPVGGLILHNVTEVTLTFDFCFKVFWTLVAITSMAVRDGYGVPERVKNQHADDLARPAIHLPRAA